MPANEMGGVESPSGDRPDTLLRMVTRTTTRMMTRRSTTAVSGPGHTAKSVALLRVYSSESGRTYQLHQLVGKGGFGEVYLATPNRRDGLPAQICVKITDRLTPWLRESYFAELLDREPRALRVLDRFVIADGARTRYCLAMEYAVHGDMARPILSLDVRRLPCSDHLKEVIHRCLGVRGKRYEAAGELIDALRVPRKEPGFGRVRSLADKRVSFTGFLSRPRSDAIKAAKRAGAIVQSKPGRTTDVLVRGRPNVLQIAGAVGGSKLIEVRRLAEKGHAVTVIGDRQFSKLVGKRTKTRR